MNSPARVRWWVKDAVPLYLSYACTSQASQQGAAHVWCLAQHEATSPAEALRWLTDHLEQHDLNSDPESAAAARWWLNRPHELQQLVAPLEAGDMVLLRLPGPGVNYVMRVRAHYRGHMLGNARPARRFAGGDNLSVS